MSNGIETPCVGVCEIDEEGICIGCDRTREEIANWSKLTNAERQEIIDDIEGWPPA